MIHTQHVLNLAVCGSHRFQAPHNFTDTLDRLLAKKQSQGCKVVIITNDAGSVSSAAQRYARIRNLECMVVGLSGNRKDVTYNFRSLCSTLDFCNAVLAVTDGTCEDTQKLIAIAAQDGKPIRIIPPAQEIAQP